MGVNCTFIRAVIFSQMSIQDEFMRRVARAAYQITPDKGEEVGYFQKKISKKHHIFFGQRAQLAQLRKLHNQFAEYLKKFVSDSFGEKE